MKKMLVIALAALTLGLGAFGVKVMADSANSCCAEGAACCSEGAACCK